MYSWNNEKIDEWIIKYLGNNINPFLEIGNNLIHTIKEWSTYPQVNSRDVLTKVINDSFKIKCIYSDNKKCKLYLSLISLTGICSDDRPDINIDIQDASCEADYLEDMYIRYNEDRNNRYYPFDITLKGVSEYIYNNKVEEDAIFIVGDSFKDFCIYFNFCRINRFVFWINEDSKNSSYITGVKNYILSESVDYKINKVIVLSNNGDIDIPDELKKEIQGNEYKKINYNQCVEEKIISSYIGRYNKIGAWEGLWFNKLEILDLISAQDFVGFENEDANIFRYLTEVEIRDYSPLNKLNAMYSKLDKNKKQQYRISKKGMVFESINDTIFSNNKQINNNLKSINIKNRYLKESIDLLLKSDNKSWNISNQG